MRSLGKNLRTLDQSSPSLVGLSLVGIFSLVLLKFSVYPLCSFE